MPEQSAPWTPAWKQQQLDALRAEWATCERCALAEGRTQVVFGNGPPDAQLMFVGEGPGPKEDEEGNPFVGPSGRLLNTMLHVAGLRREQVYATNVTACFPGEVREPGGRERAACNPRLIRQIYLVDPLIIVPVGKVAMEALIYDRDNKFSSINRAHGTLGYTRVAGWSTQNAPGWRSRLLLYPTIPIFHPAYILREDIQDPRTKRWAPDGLAAKTVDDLRHIREILDKLNQAYAATHRALRRQTA